MFQEAAAHVRDLSARRGAKTADERIYWALSALRAVRQGQHEALTRAIGAFPAMGEVPHGHRFLDAGHVGYMQGLLQQAVQMNIEARANELKAAAELPDYVRRRQTASLARWASQWSPKRCRVGLNGARLADGTDELDPAKASASLCGHWAKVFAAQPIVMTAAQTFLEQYSVPFPDVTWHMTKVEFNKVVASAKHSAAGPDGIPYAAWQAAPDAIRDALYSAYGAWLLTGDFPDDFNQAYLWLLPKGSCERDKAGPVTREPCDIRPLSGSNTDGKFFASAVRRKADSVITTWAASSQRGFISDRSMLENVVEVESSAMNVSFCQSHRSALILCDFAAAFPSSCWAKSYNFK